MSHNQEIHKKCDSFPAASASQEVKVVCRLIISELPAPWTPDKPSLTLDQPNVQTKKGPWYRYTYNYEFLLQNGALYTAWFIGNFYYF